MGLIHRTFQEIQGYEHTRREKTYFSVAHIIRVDELYCCIFMSLEIKPCRHGSRIRDVEAFWYKIIYFVTLCLTVLIVPNCMTYHDPIFLIIKNHQMFRVRVNHTIRHIKKTKKWLHFFWGWRLDFFGL